MLDTFARQWAERPLGPGFAVEPIAGGMSGGQVFRLRPAGGG